MLTVSEPAPADNLSQTPDDPDVQTVFDAVESYFDSDDDWTAELDRASAYNQPMSQNRGNQ